MKNVVETSQAPAAIGPYSQAVTFGNLIFTSGQLPLVPETMAFAEGGIREQTARSLKNVQAILEESGSSLNAVIKTTCFLADMNHFTAFNEVYTEFFGDKIPPARSCIQAGRLPKDALVEIEAVAYIEGV
ncbi:RidA family protein [Pantoea anthophila]|uniref:RidA family protein n=1 Tax=Pantoea anthophila TaxID=470931 RepID=UPI003CEFE262